MILNALMACAPSTGGPTHTNETPDHDHVFDSGVAGTEGCEGDVGLDAGDCAPDFSLISADGGQVTLSELASQRVVVLGSATW